MIHPGKPAGILQGIVSCRHGKHAFIDRGWEKTNKLASVPLSKATIRSLPGGLRPAKTVLQKTATHLGTFIQAK